MKPKRDFRPMGEYVIRWIEESRDVAPATMSVASLLVSMGRTPRSNGSRGQRTSRIFAAIGHLSMQRCNTMRLQCLDNAVEDQSDAYGGDKEADDTGYGIYSSRAQFI